MLIGKDSPLRNLLKKGEPKRTLLADGIRISIDIADISFDRLCKTLLALDDCKEIERQNILASTALADAWSIIDSLDKVRGLLKNLLNAVDRSCKDNSGGRIITNVYDTGGVTVHDFIKSTEVVFSLRNKYQHVNSRIDSLLCQNNPIWGLIYWIDSRTIKREGKWKSYTMGSITSHSLSKLKQKIKYSGAPRLGYPLGQISLAAHGENINLSETMVLVCHLVKNLEYQLGPQFAERERHQSSMYIRIHVKGGA